MQDFDQLLAKWKEGQITEAALADALVTPSRMQAFVNWVKAGATSLGIGTAKIPDDPASFAEKFSALCLGSAGIRFVWQREQHLDLINDRLVQLEERKIQRLIIALQPRAGKTEFATFWFPLWYLARNPRKRVVLAGHTAEFMQDYGRRLRDFIRDHGDKIGLELSPSSTAAHHWSLMSGGTVTTVGRGGALTGKGADLLVLDDMIKDEEEASSELIRERLWSWWVTVASTRLEPASICIHIGTRWHFDDLAGRLEAQNKIAEAEHWDVIRIKALAEDADDPLGRAVGEPISPRFPVEWLLKKKASSTAYWWSANYQQEPISASGGMFQMNWWQFYDVLPDKFDVMIQSWDFSFKDTKKSDYVVGQIWGRKGASFYLVDQIRDQMNAKASISAIRAFTEKYPQARAKLFEDKANGPALKALLNHEVGGIIPVNPRGSKEVRAMAVQPFVQAGNVHLPHPSKAPWVNDALIELAQFPLGRHDDVVDSLTLAINYLAPGSYAAMNSLYSSAKLEDGMIGEDLQTQHQKAVWKAMEKARAAKLRADKGLNPRAKINF